VIPDIGHSLFQRVADVAFLGGGVADDVDTGRERPQQEFERRRRRLDDELGVAGFDGRALRSLAPAGDRDGRVGSPWQTRRACQRVSFSVGIVRW